MRKIVIYSTWQGKRKLTVGLGLQLAIINDVQVIVFSDNAYVVDFCCLFAKHPGWTVIKFLPCNHHELHNQIYVPGTSVLATNCLQIKMHLVAGSLVCLMVPFQNPPNDVQSNKRGLLIHQISKENLYFLISTGKIPSELHIPRWCLSLPCDVCHYLP